MRPLTLRLEGLRSYRSPQTVEFDGRDMVAVVGDTGAGKSSLLEAITFALYGATTWSKQAGDLIGDRADTMKVELTFRADGADWQVTRTMSKGSRPSIHRLENLQTGERIDGVNEVARVIQRLLGLDYDGFLRTVLLPQGKFAQLLEARPTDRQKILRNIFRVDELEKVRERSKELHTRLSPRLDGLLYARSQMAEDPRAAAEEASRRAAGADALVKELDAAATEVTLAQRAADEARREVDGLRRLAEAVDIPGAVAAAGRVREIADADADLRRAVVEAEEAFATTEAQVAAAEEALRIATAAGDTEPALRTARAALDALPGLTADIAAVVAARGRHDCQAEEARQHDDLVVAARAELAEASAGTAALDREIAAGQTGLDGLRRGIDQVTGADQQLAEAADRSTVARGLLDDATVGAEQARADADRARADATEADERLAAARRADAAAHAASGIAPGDPCPVCDRTLPDGFRPPSVPALAAADEAAGAARIHAEALGTAATRAEAHREAALAGVATAEELVEARRAAVATARTALAHAAGVLQLPDGPVDADALLRDPTEALTALGDQRAQLAERIEGLRADVVKSETRATDLRERVEEAHAADARAVASSRGRLTQVLAALGPVPAWSPDLPDLGAVLDAADPAAPAPSSLPAAPGVDVTSAVARIDERLAELAALSGAVGGYCQRRDQARTTLEQVTTARRRAAAGTAEPYRVLDQFGARLHDAARRTGTSPAADPPPERAEPDGLAAGATWAETLVESGRGVAEALAVATDEQATTARAHEEAAAGALAQAGVPDAATLHTHQAGAIADATTARQDEERALADVPRATDLDRRIVAAREFLDAVGLVRDRLANSAFIGEVMKRRHAELLGVASRILGEVTGDRYGFSPDFAIVDLHTGQERATKTLSGGESFLASLALALSMVEIAGRGGGRLDALFLDEGFGSLDRTSLDAAIDALESRAKSGRLVAVISHVPGVAERIDDVLEVRATAAGSIATWQSTADREAAFAHDLATALTPP